MSALANDPAPAPLLRRPTKQARSRGDRPFAVWNYAGFTLFAILCAYPFWYLVVNSISANDLSAAGDIRLFPQGFHLTNYTQVLGSTA